MRRSDEGGLTSCTVLVSVTFLVQYIDSSIHFLKTLALTVKYEVSGVVLAVKESLLVLI